MNERTLIDFLGLQNKWWESKKQFPIHRINKFKRSDYAYLKDNLLYSEEATVITGPRGVGKSTILLEIIRKLLGYGDELGEKDDLNKIPLPPDQGNVNNRRIIYVTFEEESLQKIKITDVLKIYAKYVLKEDISQLSEKIYVFLDEIQNVNDWGTQIKIIQDLKYPIKIFISGSSSVNMLNESSKAARRVDVYPMYPLKFSDYVKYKINDKNLNNTINEFKKYRAEFFNSIEKNNPQQIYDKFLQTYIDLKTWQIKIELLFEEYIIKGGYPGLMKIDSYVRCATKLRNTFWLGFHKDLVLSKGIKNPKAVKELTEYVSSISSCETNNTSLMKKSKAASNQDTLKNYMYHLEQAFLIKESHRHSKDITRKSSSFKIYLVDIAIRNMLQSKMNELLLKDQTELGFALETLIFDHSSRLFHKIRPDAPLSYWKDSKSNLEVDIILKLNGHSLPIEVKKSDSPSLSDVRGLQSFCKDDVTGIVVCGKRLSLEGNIIFVPHWLFTLLC